jgi:MFS family permease
MTLNSLPFGFTLVVLPIYLTQIGFSAGAIGLIISVSGVANTAGLMPAAIAANTYGRKTLMFLGFITSSLAYVLFALSRTLNLLLLASAIGGVGLAGGFTAAIWTPAWTALLAETEPEMRTSAFGWSQGLWTIALSTGSAMSVLPAFFQDLLRLSIETSTQLTFMIFACIAIVSGIVVLPVSETRNKQTDQTRLIKWSMSRESFRHIAKCSFTFGLVGFSSGIALQLLSLWFNKMYGVDAVTLGPWFAVAEITPIVVVPVIPKVARRLGSVKSVLAAQGMSAIVLSCMILAPTYQDAGLLLVARNFLMNISWPVQQSYLMGTVVAEERASASAITYTIWGLGLATSPVLAGLFLSSKSFMSISAPIIIGAVGYFGSALLFYLFFRKFPPPDEVAAQ